ncbi:26.2 kDa heat shock protein, mitochondrial-like [Lolium rigidum]|uniref:26.2 kDa heat shock protein, mitochondrial-like n=1 Tax=Lolium rigidum TaxID=89674 RepID=UPI001F5C0E7C|nr:26.2 kDa heat shock protein, mitochondrial-like [Lolium rigidum]
MASAVACTDAALASLKKLLAEPSPTGAPVSYCALSPAAVRRLCSTQGKEVRRSDDDDDKTNGEYKDADAVGRRRARDSDLPSFFSHDVFDRFGAPTSLGRLLGLMEDAVAAPGLGGLSSTARRGWSVAKEDDDAVYLKVPMPGFGKEHVKVSAEQNSLVIKGEGEKDAWNGDKDDAAVPKYSGRIEMPAGAFKMDKIKAEMKNGVLMVTVPKLKMEERKDVFQIAIE